MREERKERRGYAETEKTEEKEGEGRQYTRIGMKRRDERSECEEDK